MTIPPPVSRRRLRPSVLLAASALTLLATPALAQNPTGMPSVGTSDVPRDPPKATQPAPVLETPPPAGTTEVPAAASGIKGRVTDAKTAEGLIEATVRVVAGGTGETVTDVDGNFELDLPPGTYELRVYYELYQGRRITGVVVEAGKRVQLPVGLTPDADAVVEVVIETRADKRSESALLSERRKAAVVSDGISAQEVARTPDSNASDSVKRVVSATVVDGKYVLLRGLGGRYSQTLLNGALLPSPEPDEPAVPLDIFPNTLLSNMTVAKSYDASLPGTFGGGTLQIETNTYPSKFEFTPKLSIGMNSETTLRQGLKHASRARGLPGAVPKDGPAYRLSPDQMQTIGRSFPNQWTPVSHEALPNFGVGFSIGDTFRKDGRRLGYLAALNYGRAEQFRDVFVGDVRNTLDGALEYKEQGQAQLSSLNQNINGLANIGLSINSDHEFTLFSLYTRGTETQSQAISGFDQNNQENFDGSRLQHIERALSFNQLRGFHRMQSLKKLELDWQANFSRVDRAEPDTRDITYFLDEDGTRRFKNQPSSGARFYSELGENSGGGTLNATLPFESFRIKVGGLAQVSQREFNARRFRFSVDESAASDLMTLPADQMFAPENIGNGVRFEERTLLNDSYEGKLGVYAGFLSTEIQATEKLKVLAGGRYETAQQDVTGRSPYDISTAAPVNARRSYADVLPSANLVYALSESLNLRAGYSYTLARPTFREIAPFLFYDFVRRRAVVGNPDLVQSRIHHADLRAEWFLSDSEVLSAGVFGKRFELPIERVLFSGGEMITYRNAQSANLLGAELEARTTLARLHPALKPFRVSGNVTLMQSEVQLDAESQRAQTSSSRAMQGQSPYIFNVNAGYENVDYGFEIAALYNVYGKRISEVGIQGNPDIFELPFHRVDLVIAKRMQNGLELKLSGQNLLNSSIRLEQGGLSTLSYRPGVSVIGQVGWRL